MTKKIFLSIFLVATAVLLACLVLVMGVLYGYFSSMQKNTLAAQTTLAAQGVEDEGAAYFNGLGGDGYRFTWVAADGTVLGDSAADAASMENHADREEIGEALKIGVGESERMSATLAEKTLYRAQKLADGTVLRVSVTQYTILTLVLGMAQPICVVLVLAIVLSALLALRLSKRIVGPLNELNLDAPLENDAYDELSPLLLRIERQHRQIDLQMNALRQKQDEFTAVIDNMNEGLILLNAKGVILSINRSAAKLFQAEADCVGQDMLTVNRSLAMQCLVSDALSGRHSETAMEFSGVRYQIVSSPVLSDDAVSGACILAFDVSERELAEQQRREFSANVSHELKTPLQSIMGSAELIENGLVKPEDMSRFIGRIRSEAARLVSLIEDIIRLSQLDEGGELPRDEVDLYEVAEEAADALRAEAKHREVTLELAGDSACIGGVRRLLYELIYNLCDNAVKYNVPGGRVTVTVRGENTGAMVSVADTGIGIPPEAQARVFERFNRVDKSHSRETGGTGLGLSIVKHAAQYHGASVQLQSAPGAGTTITVRFPSEPPKRA